MGSKIREETEENSTSSPSAMSRLDLFSMGTLAVFLSSQLQYMKRADGEHI
jgi:hypothetical protein